MIRYPKPTLFIIFLSFLADYSTYSNIPSSQKEETLTIPKKYRKKDPFHFEKKEEIIKPNLNKAQSNSNKQKNSTNPPIKNRDFPCPSVIEPIHSSDTIKIYITDKSESTKIKKDLKNQTHQMVGNSNSKTDVNLTVPNKNELVAKKTQNTNQKSKIEKKDLEKTKAFIKKFRHAGSKVFRSQCLSYTFYDKNLVRYDVSQYDKRFTALNIQEWYYKQILLSVSRRDLIERKILKSAPIFSSVRNYYLQLTVENVVDGVYTETLLDGNNEHGIEVIFRIKTVEGYIPCTWASVIVTKIGEKKRTFVHFFENDVFEIEFRFDPVKRRQFLNLPKNKKDLKEEVEIFTFQNSEWYHIEKSNLPTDYTTEKIPKEEIFFLKFPDEKIRLRQRGGVGARVFAILRFEFGNIPGDSITHCGIVKKAQTSLRVFLDLEHRTKEKTTCYSNLERSNWNENASEEFFLAKTTPWRV